MRHALFEMWRLTDEWNILLISVIFSKEDNCFGPEWWSNNFFNLFQLNLHYSKEILTHTLSRFSDKSVLLISHYSKGQPSSLLISKIRFFRIQVKRYISELLGSKSVLFLLATEVVELLTILQFYTYKFAKQARGHSWGSAICHSIRIFKLAFT
jgi:hypothetical protein